MTCPSDRDHLLWCITGTRANNGGDEFYKRYYFIVWSRLIGFRFSSGF